MSKRTKIIVVIAACLLLALLLFWPQYGRRGKAGPGVGKTPSPGLPVPASPAQGPTGVTARGAGSASPLGALGRQPGAFSRNGPLNRAGALRGPGGAGQAAGTAKVLTPDRGRTPFPVTHPVTPPVVLPPPVVPPAPVIPPGQEGMHVELIPRNITIVRCYYDEELVNPGTTFGFDINGSGFDENFQRRIQVDPDALDVEVRDLRLVTANQIHGLMVVGSEATTQYIYPKVLIRGLPVFKAPEPFGVCRPGEVLDILLTDIDETGQTGRFQILTNMDEAYFKRIRIEPTNDKLDVTNIVPKLPFYIEGALRIGEGLRSGQYGLTVALGSHPLFKKDPLVDVVRPNVGRTGSIEDVKAVEVAHRPGDTVDLTLRGSGFTPGVINRLQARVQEFNATASTITYLSQGRLQITFHLPPSIPVGVYGISITQEGHSLFEKKGVFGIVPPNWLSRVVLLRPLSPGQDGVLAIKGRDISSEFAGTLHIETDEPGLQIGLLRRQSPLELVADIRVSTAVAPGDYLLHVSSDRKPLALSGGSLIKINP